MARQRARRGRRGGLKGLLAGAALAAAACGAPRIQARADHVAMAPGTPDQVCLLCHREGSDQAEPPAHGADVAHDGCTGCHGPRHPAPPRVIMERGQ